MVTMLDVAKRAGVSKATVSRVLNGQDIVSAEVKAQVMKAIEETGYRPNILARQLARQQSNFIGFVMTNTLYNGPYFSSLVYQAASFCEKYNHQLIFTDSKHCADDERIAIQYMLDMKCKGIIIYPKYLNNDELETLIEANSTPIILINKKLNRNINQTIYLDHYKSANYLMNYLLQCGHKHIAFICGRHDSISGQLRLNAYQDKLHSAGIEVNPHLIESGYWQPEGGYKATKLLLSRKIPFTALLAANDDMAIGAMKAIIEAGLKVPDDISVAGFDNTIISRYVSPGLTTVNVPIDMMIQTAIEKIINSQFDPNSSQIDGQLIIRQSVSTIS